MNKILPLPLLLLLLGVSTCLLRPKKVPYKSKVMIKYYEGKVSLFRSLPNDQNEIIFLGNSLTDGAEWNEIFENSGIKNRGINGDDIPGVMSRLDEVTESNPSKIFLIIGTNDLKCTPLDMIIFRDQALVGSIIQATPNTALYIQSILPVIDSDIRKNSDINYLNKGLLAIAKKNNVNFINLYPTLLDVTGQLDAKYTYDGLHLNGQGYLIWASIIKQYVVQQIRRIYTIRNDRYKI